MFVIYLFVLFECSKIVLFMTTARIMADENWAMPGGNPWALTGCWKPGRHVVFEQNYVTVCHHYGIPCVKAISNVSSNSWGLFWYSSVALTEQLAFTVTDWEMSLLALRLIFRALRCLPLQTMLWERWHQFWIASWPGIFKDKNKNGFLA